MPRYDRADAVNCAEVKTSVAEASVTGVNATCCPVAAVPATGNRLFADGIGLVASSTVLAGGRLADC